VIGAALLLGVGAVAFDSSVTRARVSIRLAEFGSGPGAAGAARREAESSGIVGRIGSARIGLDAAIIEGLGGVELMRGVGHDPASALPGESGNVVLAGHRDTHFRALRGVDAGDLIELTTPDGSFTYRVDSILIVDPDRGDLVAATGEERLTLVTCYPFYWIGPAPKRLVVSARPVLRTSGRFSESSPSAL
jgi:sortase A